MDAARFDDLARSFAAVSRRSLVGGALGGIAGASLGRTKAEQATPAVEATPVAAPKTVCTNPDTTGLQSRNPGYLVAYEEITATDDANFPTGARAWRVLYVSTGRDNTERTHVCGIVVAPDSAERIFSRDVADAVTGRVVAWCHGTLGMVPRCQPSYDPANEIWGATPYGINLIAMATGVGSEVRTGAARDGILAGMIDAGWVVVGTDYYTDLWGGSTLEPYVVGKIEAANAIDNIRAAHHLLGDVYAGYPVRAYDVATWGHSQGGHAALWTGQLLTSYMAATATPDGPALSLAGIALEAPGSNFVVQPDEQPDTAPGYGDVDWLAHSVLKLTGVPEPIPGAPFFFSYLFGSWAQVSKSGSPDQSQMPAYPDVGELDLTALVVPDALPTIAQGTRLCWAAGEPIVPLVEPYKDRPFMQAIIADGPVVDGYQHGNFDATCAGNPPPEMAKWCEWLRYNLPGPLGTHPMDKLPRQDGRLVPIFIAQGSNDEVVHCVAPREAADTLPSARDCMSVALYDALQAEYCPAGESQGHLTLSVWGPEAGVTVGDHSAITALPAARSATELTYQGSPLQQFITAAFDGTLQPGCSAAVVNAGGGA